jgi:hypothetical protein
MALGDELAVTADMFRKYLADFYGGLRRIGGDLFLAGQKIYSTVPGKILTIGGAAGVGAGLLGAGLGAGIHGIEIGEFGGNPLNPIDYLSYIPYSPYAPAPYQEPPQRFLESSSLGAFFNPLILTIIIILIIIIIFLIATRK